MAEERRNQPRRKRSQKETDAFREEQKQKRIVDWVPSTELGKKVKNGEISSLDELFIKGTKIMEPEIIDVLVPDLKDKLVDFAKTTRVTRQGRNFSFRATVLVGDGNSYIGLGTAKDKERYPAINKATRSAKLAMRKILKGCGSWECRCKEKHSVPFMVTGDCGSVKLNFLPAPKGTGLVVGDKIKDVFKFAGIKDAWSKSSGRTSSTLEFVTAAVDALGATNNVKLSNDISKKLEVKK